MSSTVAENPSGNCEKGGCVFISSIVRVCDNLKTSLRQAYQKSWWRWGTAPLIWRINEGASRSKEDKKTPQFDTPLSVRGALRRALHHFQSIVRCSIDWRFLFLCPRWLWSPTRFPLVSLCISTSKRHGTILSRTLAYSSHCFHTWVCIWLHVEIVSNMFD